MTETLELAKALAENEELRVANKELVLGITTITLRLLEDIDRQRAENEGLRAENEGLRAELRQAIKELADCEQFSDY